MKIIIIAVLTLALCTQGRLLDPYPDAVFSEEQWPTSDGRVWFGSPADEGQFPYQALLLLSTPIGQINYCGGSLISTKWVLTAAHCFQHMIRADVHLGSVRFQESPTIVTSHHLYMHPQFTSLPIRNDIGLVSLPYDVQLTDNIQTIPLAIDPSITYADEFGLVSGFGSTQYGGGLSPELYYAPVRITSNDECREYFNPIHIIDTVLCTFGVHTEIQGPCYGDSGGPLAIIEDGVAKQVGIVSFTAGGGCQMRFPKGFFRPNHYIPWITEVTGMEFK